LLGGGPCRHAATAWRAGPAGVEDPGIAAPGLPRNLGDLFVSTVPFGLRGAAEQRPQAPGQRLGRRERRCGRKRWYRQGEPNEPGGTGVQGSEGLIVPRKPANGPPGPGPVEGRGPLVNQPLEGNMAGAQEPGTVSTRRQRIAELARQDKQRAFTSLNHHLNLSWLLEAFRSTRRDGAPGVDGRTAADYEANLVANLRALLDRAKSGTYRAPPVRRVHIPKGHGSTQTRPIGIPTLEDKVLQRAVVMALEPIYEQDFYDCSYGFRPGRSAHQALEELWHRAMDLEGGWVLEVDIRKFFDTLDHGQLCDLLKRRVRDGVLLRLIGKWLNAGVWEEGAVTYPTTGSPQGGVISPLLANVYLHYVLDDWWYQEVVPRLRGRAFLIRYADDFVIGFEYEGDARRVMEVLPKRFGKYGLTIHPDKTRLVSFRRPRQRRGRGEPGPQERPGVFDFLGFTHHWGGSRGGRPTVKRRTAASRIRRFAKAIAEWCRRNRHRPVREQHRTLSQKLQGHYGYYGITGNYALLNRARWLVAAIWRKWLCRRSWKSYVRWPTMVGLLGRLPLPAPRVVHSVYRSG
jgi:RNA-directed DNA polymerase